MASSDFHFKQFWLKHDRCAMKVGTDGVLLGAWADSDAKHFLDIGTGSGLIALMLAQRSHAEAVIDAVEIDADAATQAIENVRASPWPNKVKVFNTPVQNFAVEKCYDVIVCNPPYFSNSYKPKAQKRYQARHNISLSFIELIQVSCKAIKLQGSLNVILPYQEGIDFIRLAAINNLHCYIQCGVKVKKEKPVERWLLSFSPEPTLPYQRTELVLYESDDQRSNEYVNLIRNFYLNL